MNPDDINPLGDNVNPDNNQAPPPFQIILYEVPIDQLQLQGFYPNLLINPLFPPILVPNFPPQNQVIKIESESGEGTGSNPNHPPRQFPSESGSREVNQRPRRKASVIYNSIPRPPKNVRGVYQIEDNGRQPEPKKMSREVTQSQVEFSMLRSICNYIKNRPTTTTIKELIKYHQLSITDYDLHNYIKRVDFKNNQNSRALFVKKCLPNQLTEKNKECAKLFRTLVSYYLRTTYFSWIRFKTKVKALPMVECMKQRRHMLLKISKSWQDDLSSQDDEEQLKEKEKEKSIQQNAKQKIKKSSRC